MPTDDPIARAKAELKPFQSNIEVELEDGSRLRAVWNTVAFEEEEYGEPFHCGVVDFFADDRLPTGGFMPGFASCKPS